MFLPAGEKQFEFWKMRRSGFPNINIARTLKVSRQSVSRALLNMDKRVEELLLDMARANRIEVHALNTKYGILFGRSVPFRVDAMIFLSAKEGLQVWYEHEGECETCEKHGECVEMLRGLAEELQIELESPEEGGVPTKMAEELFEKLKALL